MKKLLLSGLALLLMHCVSPQVNYRLAKIEAKQDSLLQILTAMQDKNDFMAHRMGWRPPVDTTPKVIPLGHSFSRGAENPVLTIVEFSDLQCPYCSQLAPILDSIAKVYPKEVKIVFKNFPLSFHEHAKEAAAAAIAAGKQGKFFEFRTKMIPAYRNLGDSSYIAAAKSINLDLPRFQKEKPLTPEIEKILQEDLELGRQLGVEGTPTVFVNGRLAQDRSFEYFVSLIKKGL